MTMVEDFSKGVSFQILNSKFFVPFVFFVVQLVCD